MGSTNESHIIRTIEYWDIERKRYPQYEHPAVIIEEDITSRFLNIIGLFNGMIPLVAIQMNALKAEKQIGLVFTTVLDQMSFGLVDEDEDTRDIVDRSYWENLGTKKTMAMADNLLEIAKEFNSSLELKYNKFYIGLARNGQPCNFFIVKPKKDFIRFEVRLKKSDENQEKLENTGLDLMDYDNRWGYYRIRLNLVKLKKTKKFLQKLLKKLMNQRILNKKEETVI